MANTKGVDEFLYIVRAALQDAYDVLTGESGETDLAAESVDTALVSLCALEDAQARRAARRKGCCILCSDRLDGYRGYPYVQGEHGKVCDDCAEENGLLVKCNGEAHSNPYIDHCGCAPRWGWVKVPHSGDVLDDLIAYGLVHTALHMQDEHRAHQYIASLSRPLPAAPDPDRLIAGLF